MPYLVLYIISYLKGKLQCLSYNLQQDTLFTLQILISKKIHIKKYSKRSFKRNNSSYQ